MLIIYFPMQKEKSFFLITLCNPSSISSLLALPSPWRTNGRCSLSELNEEGKGLGVRLYFNLPSTFSQSTMSQLAATWSARRFWKSR